MDPADIPKSSSISKHLTPKRIIEYDSRGVPTAKTDWVLPKGKVDDIIAESMLQAYIGLPLPDGGYNLEPEYEGSTNIEVAILRQVRKATAGDSEALKTLLDRLLGKPKQQVEATVVNLTVADYIKALELNDNINSDYSDIIV